MLRRLKRDVMAELPPKRRQVVRLPRPKPADWPNQELAEGTIILLIHLQPDIQAHIQADILTCLVGCSLPCFGECAFQVS